jgi:hypothetical protein
MIVLERRQLLGACASALLLASGPAVAALKSPDGVRTSLRIMNQVVTHTGRLIMAANYDQLPQESREFTEGAELLRSSIAGEPETFKARVYPLIRSAVLASSDLNAASKSRNPTRIRTAHEAFGMAVQRVIGQFPENLRPPAVFTRIQRSPSPR